MMNEIIISILKHEMMTVIRTGSSARAVKRGTTPARAQR